MSVSVIIPVHNNWRYTRQCLRAVIRTAPGAEVIVVDDASTDATHDRLRRYSRVGIVTLPTNRGFPAACNAGAAAAHGQTLVFLNNDTIPLPNWLEWLSAALARPSVGAAGPISNFVSGPQHFPAPWPRWRRGLEKLDPRLAARARRWGRAVKPHGPELVEVNRLVGFCLAVRRDTFGAVGGWDEAFGVGMYEDDALCLTLRRHGWRLVFDTRSHVFHVGQATLGKIDGEGLMLKNRALFVERYGPQPAPEPRPFEPDPG